MRVGFGSRAVFGRVIKLQIFTNFDVEMPAQRRPVMCSDAPTGCLFGCAGAARAG
jgi:hypothetical protein